MPMELWSMIWLALNTNAYGSNLQTSMRNLLLAVTGDATESTPVESDTEL